MSCTGLLDGEIKKFDITVNPKNGDMYGFPNFLAMGCARLKPDDVLNDTNSIDNNYVTATCKNSIWMSFLKLSRNSGNLNISTFDIKKNKLDHDTNFQCKKIEKKIF
jgi:hypothetical protein